MLVPVRSDCLNFYAVSKIGKGCLINGKGKVKESKNHNNPCMNYLPPHLQIHQPFLQGRF